MTKTLCVLCFYLYFSSLNRLLDQLAQSVAPTKLKGSRIFMPNTIQHLYAFALEHIVISMFVIAMYAIAGICFIAIGAWKWKDQNLSDLWQSISSFICSDIPLIVMMNRGDKPVGIVLVLFQLFLELTMSVLFLWILIPCFIARQTNLLLSPHSFGFKYGTNGTGLQEMQCGRIRGTVSNQ